MYAKPRRGVFCTAAASVLCLTARADSLTEIAAFAETICNQSLSGSESSTTIVANLNGDIQGLAKALGISVAGGALRESSVRSKRAHRRTRR